MDNNAMKQAVALCERFGGDPDDVHVGVGTQNGWGWADVVLAAHLPAGYDGNPYEYVAYDVIRDEYQSACDAVEQGESGADARLRMLLAEFKEAVA